MSISLAEGRENCGQILLGVNPIENKKKNNNRDELLVLSLIY